MTKEELMGLLMQAAMVETSELRKICERDGCVKDLLIDLALGVYDGSPDSAAIFMTGLELGLEAGLIKARRIK